MNTEEIISKIQSALIKVTKESGIPSQDVRIKLSLKKSFIGNSLKSTLLNKTSDVKDIDLKSLLGLNAFEYVIVGKFLTDTLSKKASQIDGASDQTIDARICTRTSDYFPSVYLFNEGKYVREITVSELVS